MISICTLQKREGKEEDGAERRWSPSALCREGKAKKKMELNEDDAPDSWICTLQRREGREVGAERRLRLAGNEQAKKLELKEDCILQ
jgi:hypothetical protein